ncbi:MAG: decarboxylating 6-phosphogluconate dehydrogenase [Ignavibacteriaceae bacterium]|nr:decarboxylating 6-phosphogluconate dehydrogenase [Ignavibacterium sp.]MCC6255998.1 decarboxylating 6-phosphogluconate dehydrogenase [Ignavibacteriaceae bacterium]HRP91691.1 decarboxylating 6-phosphogluconate dehydrogenase [Ignavibacteriaceae bacterium]HRQ53338.1 decarboxylating 6-phosphogluconate dehydrogenase [Ignavibacteriaceae bacterium]
MKIGFIGLGKMGFNMVQRLLLDKHEVVVFNRDKAKIDEIAKKGAIPAYSLEELVNKLPEKKVIWLMVPSGKPVDENIDLLKGLLKANDIIIDGGNSYWRESQQHAEMLAKYGVYYLDCGTSGGVWGLQNGYCLMYGGDKKSVDYVEPIFKSLAPKNGYVYCGQSGTGHLVKMVHNGIEYGMMQSYAEGFEILEKSPYKINLTKVADAWQYGSVVRSWLLELAVNAFKDDPKLEKLKDYVQDSGEGRWTVQTAMDFEVPANVITSSLYARFQSRQDESFAMKVLAALRNQFGGHAVKTKE